MFGSSRRRPTLKTVFVCESLNYEKQALDTRRYEVNSRLMINYHGRMLPMVVEEVVEDGGVRQVRLAVARAPESLTPTAGGRSPEVAALPGRPATTARSSWIDALLDRIEGGRGPIVW